ncbi:amino acid/amide ABC transporter substrate-binding protein, HAAT family [Rhizobiales bacterium GAS191]|nr:amino acid/amide ABC transporter substrate-binding protein, HAAT family [Rhizobiales bacterium GAS113]SED17427.1 amino acid/amide ABC transporter substrate-binding protein, HAAT family [Rhizobiales bacterium GAS191]
MPKLTRRQSLGAAAALAFGGAGRITTAGAAAASAANTLRLGIITDMSGPYRDDGLSSKACALQAFEDFDVAGRGWSVELRIGDHQNRADIAATIAREWFDTGGVDALLDVTTSATALAVNGIARAQNKVMLVNGAGTTELTGAQCSPNTIHWTWDTYMLAHASPAVVMGQGGDSWFFLGANYAFGHQLVQDASAVVTGGGGKVQGAVYYPFPGTVDFSSYLLQAQASGAKVLGLATSGGDTLNCLKQAREFGLGHSMKIVTLLMYNTNVQTLGLDLAQGLLLTETFYWDLNARTRAFMARLKPKTPANWPNMATAGSYGATMHYLKAVADLGIARAKADGAATVARMKAMATDDDAFGKGYIRADGRAVHPAYLFEVKTPAESSGLWDNLKLVATIPGEQAFRPLEAGNCPMVKS